MIKTPNLSPELSQKIGGGRPLTKVCFVLFRKEASSCSGQGNDINKSDFIKAAQKYHWPDMGTAGPIHQAFKYTVNTILLTPHHKLKGNDYQYISGG